MTLFSCHFITYFKSRTSSLATLAILFICVPQFSKLGGYVNFSTLEIISILSVSTILPIEKGSRQKTVNTWLPITKNEIMYIIQGWTHYPCLCSIVLWKETCLPQKTLACPLPMLGTLKNEAQSGGRDCGEWVCSPQEMSVLNSSRWMSLPRGEHNKLLPQLWCLRTQCLSLPASLLCNQVGTETSKGTLMELTLLFYMP